MASNVFPVLEDITSYEMFRKAWPFLKRTPDAAAALERAAQFFVTREEHGSHTRFGAAVRDRIQLFAMEAMIASDKNVMEAAAKCLVKIFLNPLHRLELLPNNDFFAATEMVLTFLRDEPPACIMEGPLRKEVEHYLLLLYRTARLEGHTAFPTAREALQPLWDEIVEALRTWNIQEAFPGASTPSFATTTSSAAHA